MARPRAVGDHGGLKAFAAGTCQIAGLFATLDVCLQYSRLPHHVRATHHIEYVLVNPNQGA
jgi:hypothetical protein